MARTRESIRHRVKEIGLQGSHARPNGWRTEPPWTDRDIEVLRRDYGQVKTKVLALNLGRKRGGVYNKAFSLGLVHGYFRAVTDDERRAIRLARDHGVSVTDLSIALGRDPALLCRLAIGMGIPFSTRTVRASRRPRADRPVPTLAAILTLGEKASDPSGTTAHTDTLILAMPSLPPMPQIILAAMHRGGILKPIARGDGIVII